MKESLELKRVSNPSFVLPQTPFIPDVKGIEQSVEPYLTLGVPEHGAPNRLNTSCHISQRLEILRNAYISAAGHTRPGVPQELPIDDAITEANRLTKMIRSDE